MKTFLSYGGGVNSTALLILKESEIDEAVFCDHSEDYPETYEYIKYMEKQGFPISIIRPDVEGFNSLPDFCEKKKLIPGRRLRFCSAKFKIRPLTKYIGANTPARLFIGFCAGEEKRIKSEFRFKKGVFGSYPLIQAGIDRAECIKLIQEAGLKVPPRSCCWFCFNAKKEEIAALKLNHPDLWLRRRNMIVSAWENWGRSHYKIIPAFIGVEGL